MKEITESLEFTDTLVTAITAVSGAPLQAFETEARERLQGPYVFKSPSESLNLALEVSLYWRGKLYDLKEVDENETVLLGSHPNCTLVVPSLVANYRIAKFTGRGAEIKVPEIFTCSLYREERYYDHHDVRDHKLLVLLRSSEKFYLKPGDVFRLQIDGDFYLSFRYVSKSRSLSTKKLFDLDRVGKQSFMGSAIAHVILMIAILILDKPVSNLPKLEKVPPRYAKLLVKPEPKPEPPKPPEIKKPEPKPVVQEKPKPKPKPKPVVKVIPKPKPVVAKPSKVLEKVNKLPAKFVSRKVPKAPPSPEVKTPPREPAQFNVEKVGALAALGAIGTSPKEVKVAAINVNENAGGSQAMNTSNLLGTLQSKTGKLAASGTERVKTKGSGFGTGTGYGVQGLKGQAGNRGVAGVVVGTPKLFQVRASEGLTHKQVMAVVKQYLGQIQQCYERALLSDPNLAGRVEYEWLIQPDGRVSSAQVKKTDMSGGDNLNGCVREVFMSMAFPAAKNGQSTKPNIGFPFGRL